VCGRGGGGRWRVAKNHLRKSGTRSPEKQKIARSKSDRLPTNTHTYKSKAHTHATLVAAEDEKGQRAIRSGDKGGIRGGGGEQVPKKTTTRICYQRIPLQT